VLFSSTMLDTLSTLIVGNSSSLENPSYWTYTRPYQRGLILFSNSIFIEISLNVVTLCQIATCLEDEPWPYHTQGWHEQQKENKRLKPESTVHKIEDTEE